MVRVLCRGRSRRQVSVSDRASDEFNGVFGENLWAGHFIAVNLADSASTGRWEEEIHCHDRYSSL